MKVDSVREGHFAIDTSTYADALAVTVVFTNEEMTALLSAYNPNVGTSPSITDARPVLRAILNAALENRS